ncbi:TetR/AcrR family transcriptional regulator [Paracoccus aurantiacus]|uniref:TetR/AcrR family transcriptional regulator n=1 Tax=Paracoccus aurantiacus TaxID=2599412 RepID=A0A5C6S3Q2_9RHOB|nr:TetR/AcrR family transcriptional regulator [Paracoccus aurantiacus]TXB68600.1 TetR/AcrR family transcriptional regulator [Paracoccus aurantiacus]
MSQSPKPTRSGKPRKAGPRATQTRRTREELRAETLAAAREIILQDGPEALTARRLAQAVGYTAGTIYNLFDSLPDVLWQVNRENFSRIATLFKDLPGDDPAERLRALTVRYLDLVEAEPMLFRALFDGPRKSEKFPDWYMDAISTLLDGAAIELRALAPKLTREAAKSEAAAMFAAVQGIASLRASGRLELLTPVPAIDLADRLITRVLRDASTQGG